MQHQPHQHPFECCSSGIPHPGSGEYLVSWLDALSTQENGWCPSLYPDHPRSSQHFVDVRTIASTAVDGFSSNFHQGSSASYQYQNHLGTSGGHSNSQAPSQCHHHNSYPSAVPHRHSTSTFYEGPSPELSIYQPFPPFDFADADSTPSISSSPAATDTESVSTSASGRKNKIELAPDQPLTVDGKPRKRVFVACDRW